MYKHLVSCILIFAFFFLVSAIWTDLQPIFTRPAVREHLLTFYNISLMFCIHTWCDKRRREMKRRRRHIMQIKGRGAESREVWLERGIGGVQDGEEEGAGSRQLRPEGPRGATRSSRTHWVASVWQSWKWVPCRRAGSKPGSVDPSCPKATSQGEARIKNPELKGGKWVLKNEWGTVPWLRGEGENREQVSEREKEAREYRHVTHIQA